MRDVAYYLDRGFDRPWAEYFAAGRRRAVRVAALDGMSIEVAFDDGARRSFDCAGLARPGGALAPLSDPAVFSRAYVDGDGSIAWDVDPSVDSAVVWSNKLDIDPDTVYVEGMPL
jgi:hypothetical protein